MSDPLSSTQSSLAPQDESGPQGTAESNFMIDDERREWLLKNLGASFCRKIGVYPIPPDFVLSVVIPVYNERKTIHEILRRVRAVPIRTQIILVDDCSKDGTADILRELAKTDDDLTVAFHDRQSRQGRGASARASSTPPATSLSFKTPTSNTTPHNFRTAPADHRGQGRRRLRLAVHRRDAPRALLLALGGQQVPDAALEHVHQPEPHRHGSLLQGLPSRDAFRGSRSRATVSASSPRSPPR